MNRINTAIASYNSLLTPVGAALIIAEKLKVKVNMNPVEPSSQEEAEGTSSVKIKDLIDGMKNIVVFGRVAAINPVREFTRQDGRKGAVSSMVIKDATGSIRVSLWDQKATLLESSITIGMIVGIYNAYTKIGREAKLEMHIDNRGTIKPKPDDVDAKQFPDVPSGSTTPATMKDITENSGFCNFTAKVLEKVPPKTFQKKDGTEGSVARVRVGDDSGTYFVIFWADRMKDYEDLKMDDVYEFNGLAVKKSQFANALEFHVNRVSKIKKSTKKLDVKYTPSAQSAAPGAKTQAVSAKIKDIPPDTGFCTFTAKVIEKLPPRAFQKKDGTAGSVARVKVGDESAGGFIVFWADRMKDYEDLQVGEIYEFNNLAVKKSQVENGLEFHVNRGSKIAKSNEALQVVIAEVPLPAGDATPKATIEILHEIPQNAFSINVKAKIAMKFDAKSFNKNGKEGKVARVNIVDKEQQSMTVVFWTERMKDFDALNVGDVVEIKDVSAKLNRDKVELTIKSTSTITTVGKEAVQAVKLKIGDIKENQAGISFEGRIKNVEEERQVKLKDGTQANLVNFVVGDETGSISVVAWRELADEVKKLKPGDPIMIENVNTGTNKFQGTIEARLVKSSKIAKLKKTSLPALDALPEDNIVSRASNGGQSGPGPRITLDKIEDNMRGDVLARITHLPKFINHYMACPDCRKKVTEQGGVFSCAIHGKVKQPSARLIARLTVDDGMGSINVSMIGDSVVDLFGITEQEKEKLAKQQQDDEIMNAVSNRILLKSYIFRGRIKYNEYRQEFEIVADRVIEADLNKEIKTEVDEIESAS